MFLNILMYLVQAKLMLNNYYYHKVCVLTQFRIFCSHRRGSETRVKN